jgi:hypothetical protein
MPQIVIAVGTDPAGNLTNLYTGSDKSAALRAIDDAGKAGAIMIGSVYENPIAATTLRAPPASAGG